MPPPAVPAFQGAPQFSKYLPHKNKISDSDALRSPVPAVHNSFIVSVAHYSHIPPAELSISSPAKLESESWERSKVAVMWALCFPFIFPWLLLGYPFFFTSHPARNITFILCLQAWAAWKSHMSNSRFPDLEDFRGIKICDCQLDAEPHRENYNFHLSKIKLPVVRCISHPPPLMGKQGKLLFS